MKEVREMLKKYSKILLEKATKFTLTSLPGLLTAMLIIHTNSTGCFINGQPTPPDSIKKYRKF